MQVGAVQSRLTVQTWVTAEGSRWCTRSRAHQPDQSSARMGPTQPGHLVAMAIGLQKGNDDCRQSRVTRPLGDRVEGGVLSYYLAV